MLKMLYWMQKFVKISLKKRFLLKNDKKTFFFQNLDKKLQELLQRFPCERATAHELGDRRTGLLPFFLPPLREGVGRKYGRQSLGGPGFCTAP